MNKRKTHKILSWLLLLFFTVGQVVVYAHQHHSRYRAFVVHSDHFPDKRSVVQEKCNFCDQMHHAAISCVHHPDFGIVLTPSVQIYAALQYHYKDKKLVHADGLSPPSLG